jgi:anti-sigma regulatory factor (Ser/Thr protein kinase)
MEQASGVDDRRVGPFEDRAARAVARGQAFSHRALLHAGEDEFAAGAASFADGALRAGEPLMLAVRHEREGRLREALGDDAQRVMFCDAATLGRNPARLIPAWLRFLDEHGDDARGVSVLAESVWPGRTRAELSECARYEGLLNVAFGGGRAWHLLCPYDVQALDEEVITLARCTHPLLCMGGKIEPSASYVGADAVHPLEGQLPDPPAGALTLTFTITNLHELRQFVTAVAHSAGLSSERTENLRLAVNELASNSVRHGGGAGTLRSWQDERALVCQVNDQGCIRERLVGRLRPDADQASGRGLWLVNHLCDLVQIRSGARGSVVRVHMCVEGASAPRGA